jgi:hypothetical protein
MPLTKVSFSVIQVANNVTSRTVGNTTSIPSITFDQNGVITSASNVTPSIANTQITGTLTGSQISSNTVANTNIQTGAIENYSRDQYLSINRNKIINGDMKIDQRYFGANTVIPAYTATYVMDRWFGNAQPNASKFSMQQMESANTSSSNYEASSAPSGYTNSMKVNSTTAMSVSTGEIYFVAQRIEGYNTYRLGWGAAGAKSVTLSFWVKSSLTGTFGGSLVNSANDYCYPFTYTIVAANTWEQKFITIAGPTAGTWKKDYNIGIQINFALATGSSYTATAGSWTGTANIFGATGQTNVLASQGNTWYLTGVQFEVGSTASNFEFRPFSTELQLCQRYCQSVSRDNPLVGARVFGTIFNSSRAWLTYFPPTTLRASPTVSYPSVSGGALDVVGVGNSSFTSYNDFYFTPSAVAFYVSGLSGSPTIGNPAMLLLAAGQTIIFNAEL